MINRAISIDEPTTCMTDDGQVHKLLGVKGCNKMPWLRFWRVQFGGRQKRSTGAECHRQNENLFFAPAAAAASPSPPSEQHTKPRAADDDDNDGMVTQQQQPTTIYNEIPAALYRLPPPSARDHRHGT